MSFINVSRDGVFCFGKSFISLHNRTTLSSVHCLAKDCASHQDVEAISFVSLKSTGKSGRDSTGRNSDHAVISYRESNRFLSAVVVRCDTWSVKWTIGEFSALPSPGTVHHVIGINESSICGLVTCGDLTQIFVASELDLRSNKKDGWRSFVAVPRILNCDLGGSIVDLAEGEANKIIALTSKGTVSLLSIGISAATSGGGMEVSLSTVQFRYRFPSVSSQSHIISMGQTQPNTFALFTEGESSIHVLRMKPGSMELSSTVIDIQGSIQRVEVVGMYHLVALCQNKSVQFITVVPEEDSSTLEVLPLEPIKVPYFPVASYYNHDHQLHVIVASTEPTKSPSRVNIDEKLSAFVWCSVPLQDGPYTQSALNVATWRPLLKNEESDTLAEKPVNLLLSPEANPQDRSAGSMTLHYALTSEEMSDDAADVVVFSVRTAPYLHSRLVKQWHNAAAGLKVLLSKSCETNDPRYLSIQWNPRHLRRALRLMNQHQLCSLFLHASTVLRGSQKCRLLYSQAASAAVEVVTQIITLSRQLGVPLDPEGIEACGIFLRGARQAAHGFVSQAGRMKLMLDSCLQQRAMDSLLQGTDNKDESCPSLSAEFFGVRDIIRTQRVIPTRYSAIEWSSMCNSTVETEQIFSAAEKHLSSLRLPDGTKHRLHDWELSGRLPHSDQFVCQFEAPLVSPNQL